MSPLDFGDLMASGGQKKGVGDCSVIKTQGTSRGASWRRFWDSDCKHMTGFNGGESQAKQGAGPKGEAGAG